MNPTTPDFFLEESVKALIKVLVENLVKVFIRKKPPEDSVEVFEDTLFENYETHLIEIAKWSSDIPNFIYNNPKETRTSTIPLSISAGFRKVGIVGSNLTEEDIITINKNIILVGDPGSGKTTTIKRLIINYFLTNNDINPYAYPFLIRLRELQLHSTITRELLKTFGIKSNFRKIPYIKTITIKVRDHSTGKYTVVKSQKTEYKDEEYVGNKPLDIFIAE